MGVHLLGAFLAFFVGLAYFWVQLWLTYKAEPSQDRRWMGPLRAFFCSLCTVFFIVSILKPHTEVRGQKLRIKVTGDVGI